MKKNMTSRIAGYVTVLVYTFMFLPVVLVILLSFSSSMFSIFPIEDISLQWYIQLFRNVRIIQALKTSLLLASLTSIVSTTCGVLAALGMVRYDFPGKRAISTILVAPILLPEVVLAVGLLIFLQQISVQRSFLLLFLGHVTFTLPFVILIVQARLVVLRSEFEYAARTLGATRLQTFFSITLPLIRPAVLAGMLFSFAISFDDITGSLFWRPGTMETVPTKIFSMLRTSISPEINALATVMIIITVFVPLLGVALARRSTLIRDA